MEISSISMKAVYTHNYILGFWKYNRGTPPSQIVHHPVTEEVRAQAYAEGYKQAQAEIIEIIDKRLAEQEKAGFICREDKVAEIVYRELTMKGII